MQHNHSQSHYGVNLIGAVRGNPSWQSQKNSKFSADQFQVDWDNQVVTCPQGHQSIIWRPKIDNRGLPVIHVYSLKLIAVAVEFTSGVLTQSLLAELPYNRKPNITLYRNDGRFRKRQSLRNCINNERVWKEPYLKE